MFIDIIEQESPTNQTNRLYLNSSSDLVIEVENGAANLTLDENMASGWTNKIVLSKSTSPVPPVFVRNGNYRVKVSSKYNLTEVGRLTTNIFQNAIYVDTQYLRYSPNMVNIISGLSGNLANLKGCTKLIILYAFGTLSNLTGSLSDLVPLTDLTTLVLDNSANITGSLSDLAPLTLSTLNFSFLTNITGSLSDLAPLTSLTSLAIIGCSNITGSLSDLAPLASLTSLDVSENSNITGDIKDLRMSLEFIQIHNTRITGELIEFVKIQRASGRSTGHCQSSWWGNNVTFNGDIAGFRTPLTWTENTITLGDVTIEQ